MRRSEIESYQEEVARLKEHVKSQQAMLESTTKYLMNAQGNLEEKRAELERKNQELFQNINYASHVQKGLFPSAESFKPFFQDVFIRLKQRDAIGGDMPFFFNLGKEVVVAVVDCTGHGVSGAMLTTLAHMFLYEIFSKPTASQESLGDVLSTLNRNFINVFNPDEPNHYGMDVALLKLNTETNECEFAGAGRPLILVRNGQLEKFEKTALGIGMVENQQFDSLAVKVEKGDIIYLFSDGMSDQLGEQVPKKFSERRLRDLLVEINYLKLSKQGQVIFDYLSSWQGAMEQTDDQLIIGLKIK